ncbi:MAG: rhomboid family intramembrane serine protease [Chitinophagaceae bacterium]|nr:rhomboid family intramembrane serine protease [Chitinophagaceae bacterium]
MTLGQSGNAVTMLVVVSLVLFAGLGFMKAVWYILYDKEEANVLFTNNILSQFVLPADKAKLLNKPWTVLTHMFADIRFFSVLANMLWLWAFGSIMQELGGNKKVAPVFIYGSLAGATAFFLSYQSITALLPLQQSAYLAGGGAGVMALVVATTLVAPSYRLFPMINGGAPLWVLTLLFLFSHIINTPVSDTAAIITLLAGATTGSIYVLFLKMGYDWSRWMSNFFYWVANLFNPNKQKGEVDEDDFVTRFAAAHKNGNFSSQQEEVDRILDKINEKGFQFLSKEEKELLKKVAEEDDK